MAFKPCAEPATALRPMVDDDPTGVMARMRARAGTVRVRTTAAAVTVVGAALVVAALAMVVLLRRSLTEDVRTTALLRAEAVASDLATGDPDLETAGEQDEEFVQVLDRDGRVVASSPRLAGLPPVARLAPGESQQVEVSFEDDPFLAVAISAGSEQGRRTVIVGRTLETVVESSGTVIGLLIAGVPLLTLIVGAVAWRVVGRALAPVEAIRAEVEAISGKELHRRVPDPPGNDEIARLAETMNQMLARLEEARDRQRRFVSDAAHELRSPVTTIRQHAEVALSHPDGTRLDELAQVVLEEDLRLQRVVEDLLLLSKIDEGTLRLRIETVDLDDLVFEEGERLRGTTDLRVDVGDVSAGRVVGDKTQLARLVRNLADNAVRHARSTVALSLSETVPHVVLAVDDDGSGIAPPERKRIFERFVRLDEARDRDSGGSGLGLAIVAEIAAAHGATVVALDGPLGGARLEVRFPRSDDGPDVQDRSAEPQDRHGKIV
jgi:signal transduction histidine kinase